MKKKPAAAVSGPPADVGDLMALATIMHKPNKTKRGRPVNGSALLEKHDNPDDVTEKPLSIRLRKCVDQVVRLGAFMTGTSVQDIVGECVETNFQEVVMKHLAHNPEAKEMMKRLLTAVRKAEK